MLIDDLLATGGTSAAAAALIQKVGGELLEAQFLIELEFLHGREKLDADTGGDVSEILRQYQPSFQDRKKLTRASSVGHSS